MRGAVAVMAGALVATASCTTDFSATTSEALGKSTLVDTSNGTVQALYVDGTTLYWLEDSGTVRSCPKDACDQRSTILVPNGLQSSSDCRAELAVVGGTQIYGLHGGAIFHCVASDASACLNPADLGQGYFVIDGPGVYWMNGSSIFHCDALCATGAKDLLAMLATKCAGAACGCQSDADCTQPTAPACDVATGACVACTATNARACAGGTPACDATQHKCVACNGDWGTTATSPCSAPAAPFCNSAGTCGGCGFSGACTMGGMHAGATCDMSSLSGACGLTCQNDTECAANQVCTSSAPAMSGVCIAKAPNGVSCIVQGRTPMSKLPRICASGVCSASDNLCGYPNGSGSCTGTPGVCRSAACGKDGACGLTDSEICTASAQCRSGFCNANGECGAPPAVWAPDLTRGFAVASGQLYFVATGPSSSLVTCAAASCTQQSVQVVRAAAVDQLVGVAAGMLYFLSGGSLSRCALPGCTGEQVFATDPSLAGGPTAPPPMATSDAVYLPQKLPDNAGFTYAACPNTGCPAGPLPAIAPDSLVGPYQLGRGVCKNPVPFAVDDTSYYWATPTIFGKPGSLVLATPK